MPDHRGPDGVSFALNAYPPPRDVYVTLPDGRTVRAGVVSMRTEMAVDQAEHVTLELILLRDEYQVSRREESVPSADVANMTVRVDTGDLPEAMGRLGQMIREFGDRLASVESRLDGATVERLRDAFEETLRDQNWSQHWSAALAQAIGSILAPRRGPVTVSGYVRGLFDNLRDETDRVMGIPPDLLAVEPVPQEDDGVPTGEPDMQMVLQHPNVNGGAPVPLEGIRVEGSLQIPSEEEERIRSDFRRRLEQTRVVREVVRRIGETDESLRLRVMERASQERLRQIERLNGLVDTTRMDVSEGWFQRLFRSFGRLRGGETSRREGSGV